MLELRNIRKDYVSSSETVTALKGVDIAFRQREFVSILGPSGCGKTTLLNIIGGLDHYSSGDLVINGRSTSSYTDRDWDVYRNHRIGFIFQSYNLIPHQTVLGNVELALTIAGIDKEERTRRAMRALDRVGLSDKYYKRPNQLSGGQCQRVAIARALVNDPEILLADEPTGALDTVTSVQIMDLIRDISGERLVIMVTHNPELAERYSSRIVRLLDGRIIEDTDPFDGKESVAPPTPAPSQRKPEKAKMSFFTAFRLSARNLISKGKRTAMVGVAGSIGIIGIAMVLAFSSGIKGYVASMQDDMLSGNPITVSQKTLDLNAMSGMMDHAMKAEILKEPNRVYINSLVAYFARMNKNVTSMMVENEITHEYVQYVDAMPSDHYAALSYGYGIDLATSIYTDFKDERAGESRNISIAALTSIYQSVIEQTEFKNYASYITSLAPSFEQAPSNVDYIAAQYDIVKGRIANDKNEIMLVLNRDEELSDLLLARLGYYTIDEFAAIVNKEVSKGEDYDEELYKNSFTYDELLERTFTWYPNDTIFKKGTSPLFGTSFSYLHESEGFSDTGAVELKVVGILIPKENVSYGSLSSGVYYTSALTEYILEQNKNAEIVNFIRNEQESQSLAQMMFTIPYIYHYTYNGQTYSNVSGRLSLGFSASTPLSALMGGMGAGGTGGGVNTSAMRENAIRVLGGNDLANRITIYPISFESKDRVVSYLDAWNADGDLIVDGKTLAVEDRPSVTYTDTLSLVINIINTMIDVVSYALIAFTSISLLVSTVMIGIITYVSVVERIKEIGVIRALGGRKKDVSHLFNAETFIIGGLAGLFGVGTTYLVCEVANAILYPLIGIRRIALLPPAQAVVLILLSIGLTLISGLLPARSAAKKDPVVALRTE